MEFLIGSIIGKAVLAVVIVAVAVVFIKDFMNKKTTKESVKQYKDYLNKMEERK